MQIVIDIPKYVYDTIVASDGYIADCDNEKVGMAVKEGTPLPKDVTNGDVIKAMFSHNEIDVIEGNIRFSLGDDWWNAPYNAESEDDK